MKYIYHTQSDMCLYSMSEVIAMLFVPFVGQPGIVIPDFNGVGAVSDITFSHRWRLGMDK